MKFTLPKIGVNNFNFFIDVQHELTTLILRGCTMKIEKHVHDFFYDNPFLFISLLSFMDVQ